VLGANLHFQHPIESKFTSHFHFYNTSVKNWIRQGVMTHMTNEYARPHWGAEGVDFQVYRKQI
jgi:hypothetical protein